MTPTPRLDSAWTESKRRGREAHEGHNPLAMVTAETEAELFDAQRDLVYHATRVIRNLTSVAERLEAEAGHAQFVNSLGVIQGDGLEIDRLCARIATLRETLRGIASARRAAAAKKEDA